MACAAALSGCAGAAHRPDALRPSTVVQNLGSYDGKIVTVSGYLVSEFENRGVWDDRSKYAAVLGKSTGLSLLIPRDKDDLVSSYSKRSAIIEGRIINLRKADFVLGSACSSVAIEVSDVRPAR